MSDSNLPEEWRPVLGFEGLYEVSSFGRIRGVERKAVDGRRVPSRLIALVPRPNGYIQVHLACRDGSKRCAMVHTLVLEAFSGPRPDGLVACHNNGSGSDNRSGNLRWDTQRNNLLDMQRHGTSPDYVGEKHPQCKLTDAAVALIFEMNKQGASRKEIALRAGISHSYVCMILKGRRRVSAATTYNVDLN